MTAQIAQHTGHLDAEGQLVTTDRWPELQQALRRFHPELRLAFDRTEGFWCVVRRDWEPVKLDAGEVGVPCLSYAREYYTILFVLRWTVMEDDKPPRHHYREPGMWVVHSIAAMDPRQYEPGNAEWVQQKFNEIALEKERKREQEEDEMAEAMAQEWATVIDPSDPVRFKPSAVVNWEGSS